MSPTDLGKYVAIIYLFLLSLGCLGIGGYDILVGKPIDTLVITVITASIGTAVTVSGYHMGMTNGVSVITGKLQAIPKNDTSTASEVH